MFQEPEGGVKDFDFSSIQLCSRFVIMTDAAPVLQAEQQQQQQQDGSSEVVMTSEMSPLDAASALSMLSTTPVSSESEQQQQNGKRARSSERMVRTSSLSAAMDNVFVPAGTLRHDVARTSTAVTNPVGPFSAPVRETVSMSGNNPILPSSLSPPSALLQQQLSRLLHLTHNLRQPSTFGAACLELAHWSHDPRAHTCPMLEPALYECLRIIRRRSVLKGFHLMRGWHVLRGVQPYLALWHRQDYATSIRQWYETVSRYVVAYRYMLRPIWMSESQGFVSPMNMHFNQLLPSPTVTGQEASPLTAAGFAPWIRKTCQQANEVTLSDLIQQASPLSPGALARHAHVLSLSMTGAAPKQAQITSDSLHSFNASTPLQSPLIQSPILPQTPGPFSHSTNVTEPHALMLYLPDENAILLPETKIVHGVSFEAVLECASEWLNMVPTANAIMPQIQLRMRVEETVTSRVCEWPLTAFQVSVNGVTVAIERKRLVFMDSNEATSTTVNTTTNSSTTTNTTTSTTTNDATPSHLAVFGHDLPCDLTPFLQTGKNQISITSSACLCSFIVSVQRYVPATVPLLMERVNRQQWSVEASLAAVKRAFEQENAEQDESQESKKSQRFPRLQLSCPIVPAHRIRLAVRGLHCPHLQCFDLVSYLLLNKVKQRWQCPLCLQETPVSQLRVDPYFNALLKHVPLDVGEVEVAENGAWRELEKEVLSSTEESDNSTTHSSSVASSGTTSQSVPFLSSVPLLRSPPLGRPGKK